MLEFLVREEKKNSYAGNYSHFRAPIMLNVLVRITIIIMAWKLKRKIKFFLKRGKVAQGETAWLNERITKHLPAIIPG